MMKRIFLAFLLSGIIVSLFLLNHYGLLSKPQAKWSPDFFVGIDVAYNNIEAIKKLANEVSSYTNLFVIGSRGITHNYTYLDEVCQYLHDKGLSFLVYREHRAPRTEWLEAAKEKWGELFLGFYAYDEVGGWQLDYDVYKAVYDADNITHAADQFVNNMNQYLRVFTRSYTNETSFPLFTSDYALYWFDYKGGYEAVFAQFGWNYSRQLNVALDRGAATAQNKDWGVMITWTYDTPPYIESGKALYDDMVLAYNNGAKYILVFDTDENYTQGILEEEHLDALKQFWSYAKNNSKTTQPSSERVAYVLPKDYGYGFRGPNDKIWGFWEADAFAVELCVNLGNVMEQYGTKLDIIYDDGIEFDKLYSKYILWNGTIILP